MTTRTIINHRQIDEQIAEKVMGWKLAPYTAYSDTKTAIENGWYVWEDANGEEITGQLEENAFSADIAATYQMEEQLVKLGVQEQYVYHLKEVVSGLLGSDLIIRDMRGWYDDMEFKFIHATPKQRCLAALLTVNLKQDSHALTSE